MADYVFNFRHINGIILLLVSFIVKYPSKDIRFPEVKSNKTAKNSAFIT